MGVSYTLFEMKLDVAPQANRASTKVLARGHDDLAAALRRSRVDLVLKRPPKRAEAQKRRALEFKSFMESLPVVRAPKGWKFDRERDGHREIKIRVGS